MAISVESTSSKILVTINDSQESSYILQRAFYKDRKWLTWTGTDFADLSESTEEEPIEPLAINPGDFIDSFQLSDGLFEYRYIKEEDFTPEDDSNKFTYSSWTKYGHPDAIGYTFGNYKAPEGEWGTILTPDDFRYTYLWGTDFKATNGTYFTDEQVQFFIDEATSYMERMLNITIVKKNFATQAADRGLIKGSDYDEEEAAYDFSYRKIQRYGMIQTKHRPILNLKKCELINKYDTNIDLLKSTVVDKKQGVIKFLDRPFIPSDRNRGISTSLGRYGSETFQPHLFYCVDYSAGYETSDDVPKDLRQMIGKVCAISLLNIIGDGLMSGFSSSSLSMDGISESFSSTQSATSAYFGARIKVYQDEVKDYIKDNKYKFGFLPIGAL